MEYYIFKSWKMMPDMLHPDASVWKNQQWPIQDASLPTPVVSTAKECLNYCISIMLVAIFIALIGIRTSRCSLVLGQQRTRSTRIYSRVFTVFIDYAKLFDRVDHNKLRSTLICLLWVSLYAVSHGINRLVPAAEGRRSRLVYCHPAYRVVMRNTAFEKEKHCWNQRLLRNTNLRCRRQRFMAESDLYPKSLLTRRGEWKLV